MGVEHGATLPAVRRGSLIADQACAARWTGRRFPDIAPRPDAAPVPPTPPMRAATPTVLNRRFPASRHGRVTLMTRRSRTGDHLPLGIEPAGTVGPLPTLPLADVTAALRAAGCVFAEDEARLLVDAARDPADLAARSRAGSPASRWSRCWAGRSSAACGSPSRRGSSCRGGGPSSLVRLAAPLLRPRRRRGRAVLRRCRGGHRTCCGGARARAARRRHRARRRGAAPAATSSTGRSTRATSTHPLPASLEGRVAVVVANAPYVPTDAIALMPPEARDHEPRVALDGGRGRARRPAAGRRRGARAGSRPAAAC